MIRSYPSTRWQEPFQAEAYLNYIPLSFLFRLETVGSLRPTVSLRSLDSHQFCRLVSRNTGCYINVESWLAEISPPLTACYELVVDGVSRLLYFEFENGGEELHDEVPLLKNVWLDGERLALDPDCSQFNIYLIPR